MRALKILILSALVSVMLSGCLWSGGTRLSETVKQPPLLLTASQEELCVTHPIARIDESNARRGLTQQAVDGANCRDKVSSVVLSVKDYNKAIRSNNVFNETAIIDESAVCEFPVIQPGNSENRLLILAGALGEAVNACASTHVKLIAAVGALNQSIGYSTK